MATCDKRGRFCGGVLTFALMVLAASFSSQARAGLVAADTANAMPGWYGTSIIQFIEETSPEKFVDGSVDFAVYAPGQFNLSFPGQDPSGGTRYVYRYQLYNNSGTSEDYLKTLTVGLVGVTNAANCKWIDPGDLYQGSGGVIPTLQVALIGTPNPTSAVWKYKASSPIGPGNYSKMLIFTSPYEPTSRLSTVNSQSTIGHWVDGDGNQYNWWEGMLPSPVPEPTTLFSLFMSGGLFIIYRVLRRK
jgi:hypothetical protein